jgi:nucleoid-associated protein YgaU
MGMGERVGHPPAVPKDHTQEVRNFFLENTHNSDSVLQSEAFQATQSVVVVVRNMGVPVTATVDDGANKDIHDLMPGDSEVLQFTRFSNQEVFGWVVNLKINNLTNKLTAAGGALRVHVRIRTMPPEPPPPQPHPRRWDEDPDPKPVPPPPHPVPVPKVYVVQKDDYLMKIAYRFYGDSNQWRKIYNANKGVIGPHPDKIFPGQHLTIP